MKSITYEKRKIQQVKTGEGLEEIRWCDDVHLPLPPGIPVLPRATLRQAVLWAAKSLPPIERRFERVLGYPEDVAPQKARCHGNRTSWADSFHEARLGVLLKLMTGSFTALGFKSTTVETYDGSGWELTSSGEPTDEIATEMPSDFWDGETIFWYLDAVCRSSYPSGTGTCVTTWYGNVSVSTKQLYRAFPDRHVTALTLGKQTPVVSLVVV